jgi:anti-sigma factor RsiW
VARRVPWASSGRQWDDDAVVCNGSSDNNDKARRFRDAALPHLDDVTHWRDIFSTTGPMVASRRSMLKGFAMGAALSAAIAASLVIGVIRTDQDQRVLGDVFSAHVRSLQADHLTDVQTSDQHTVKPWFNGKVDVAPPVVDLTAQGFTLIGGRLDYIDGRAVASIVYRRRAHVINLFVIQEAASADHGAKLETMQGFNIQRWRAQGLEFFAISDINAEELNEFVEKFEAGFHSTSAT